MSHPSNSGAQALQRRAALVGVGALLLLSSAWGQYAFDTPGDDHEESGVRYFGSAKDERGVLLADVTFLLESKQASFIFVTDAEGRFRGHLPLDIPVSEVAPKCWKAGLESVRVTKRAGPKAARPTVQVDCVLRRVAS